MTNAGICLRGCIVCLLLCIAVALNVKGQIEASLDEKEMLMGTVSKLTVNVPVDNDSVDVEIPLLREAVLQGKKYVPLLNDTLELLTKYRRTVIYSGNKASFRYEMGIQSFDSGTYMIPSLDFIVGGKKESTNKLEISVLPVKVKAEDKIDDFSDVAVPFELNPNGDLPDEDADTLLWWIIGCVVLILALITVTYILYNRNGTIFPRFRQVPPYQQALEKLAKLEKQSLPQKGKTKEYYTRLTAIIRKYLEKQFEVKTMEKTSGEILSQIESNPELSVHYKEISELLNTADFVKFAKGNTNEEENRRYMSEARTFVEDTKPASEDRKEVRRDS